MPIIISLGQDFLCIPRIKWKSIVSDLWNRGRWPGALPPFLLLAQEESQQMKWMHITEREIECWWWSITTNTVWSYNFTQ